MSRAFLLSKVACERGLRLADHWRCGMTSALALESLGLLNLAEAQSGGMDDMEDRRLNQ